MKVKITPFVSREEDCIIWKKCLDRLDGFLMFLCGLIMVLFLANSLLAQGPRWGKYSMGGPGFEFRGLMGSYLGLTDAQKTQIQDLRKSARPQTQPVQNQLKQLRDQMATAIQSGPAGDAIQKLAAQEGVLLGQLVGIQATTQSQIYALLTQEQKDKLAKFREEQKTRRQSRWEQTPSGDGPPDK
jgi:protein CpxP